MLRKKRVNVQIEEVDITSLLDVLVVLLIFLLQNLSSAELNLDLINELSLPYSQSRDQTNLGVTLQVNAKKEFYLNDRAIGVFSEEGGEEFKSLFSKKLDALKPEKAPKDGININLVFDKTLEYEFIDKVLKMVSERGFTQFKFIILKAE